MHDVAPVDRRREPGRQLHALLRLVARERRAICDVAEVGLGADVTHPLGQAGRRVHGKCERVAFANCDVDKLETSLRAQIRELARGIESRAHDRDWMREKLDAALPGGRRARRLWLRRAGLWRRQESAADVVRNIAVERLAAAIESQLPRGRRKREVHLHPLLDARAAVLQIDDPSVVKNLLPLLRRRGIAGDISAAVHVCQLAKSDDLQGLERHHAVAPAQRLGRARHKLQFGTRALAGDTDGQCHAHRDRDRYRLRICETSPFSSRPRYFLRRSRLTCVHPSMTFRNL